MVAPRKQVVRIHKTPQFFIESNNIDIIFSEQNDKRFGHLFLIKLCFSERVLCEEHDVHIKYDLIQ
jgi:hypothetical protein